MNVFLDMVGCRLNQAEIEKLAAQFRSRGHKVVAQPQLADLAVINTCSVTQKAEGDSRQKVRQIHSARAETRIVLTGCWATVAPGEAASSPGVAWVIPNNQKESFLDQIGVGSGSDQARDLNSLLREPLPGARHRTRAFLKIQDGCDSRCTFCLARVARGPSRSRPIPEVVGEAQAAQSAGVQEIVLTGVALASYGHERADRKGLGNSQVPPVGNGPASYPALFAGALARVARTVRPLGESSDSALTCTCLCNRGADGHSAAWDDPRRPPLSKSWCLKPEAPSQKWASHPKSSWDSQVKRRRTSRRA